MIDLLTIEFLSSFSLSLPICLLFIPLSLRLSWLFFLFFHWHFFPTAIKFLYYLFFLVVVVLKIASYLHFMDTISFFLHGCTFKYFSFLIIFCPCAASFPSKFHSPHHVSHIEWFLQIAVTITVWWFILRVRYLKVAHGFTADGLHLRFVLWVQTSSYVLLMVGFQRQIFRQYILACQWSMSRGVRIELGVPAWNYRKF